MSRYHPVRPKKHKHKHPASAEATAGRPQVPQPAAPAQPKEAEAEKFILDRLEKARTELYKLHNGDVLDEAIARWKRCLAIYDREAEVVHNGEPGKPHRWTVSPSMALRAENHLEGLLKRRDELLNDCHKEAHQIVTDMYSRQPKDGSLCPPKQTEAPQAGYGAVDTGTSNPSNKGGPPEAVKPAA